MIPRRAIVSVQLQGRPKAPFAAQNASQYSLWGAKIMGGQNYLVNKCVDVYLYLKCFKTQLYKHL